MESYSSVIIIAILMFTVLIAIEFAVSTIMKIKVYRWMDTISSLSSGLTNNIKSIFKLSIIVVSYEFMVKHLAVFEVEATPLVYFIGFVGIDFVSYWSHRWNHEINLFWNRHIVHHSSEEYNLAAALRQSISSIVQIYFFLYIPLAIIGIPAKVIAIIAPLHLFAQFWYHTKLINKMGFLEHIIMTPSHHRVHHAINKEYIDRNYSAIFIIWDKMFGSFQEELDDVPPVYGVKKAVRTWNPALINFMHFIQLCKDAWHAEKVWDKLRIWFMPTGWRPADVMQKYPIDYVENAYTQVKFDTPASNGLKAWSSFQLTLHLLMQFHMVWLLGQLPNQQVLFYGLFILFSVFAYSTLMDRSKWAVPMEMLKVALGLGLLYHYQTWFLLENLLPNATLIVIAYFAISIIITVFYTYFDSTLAQENMQNESSKQQISQMEAA